MSSLSLLLDKAFGWRNAVRIICGISLSFATFMFLLKEPVRNATNEEQKRMEEKEIIQLNK
jgi:hypothetical protein